jgi:hypothetical protein
VQTDDELRKSFSQTQVVYHQLPSLVPKFAQTLAKTPLSAPNPSIVTCEEDTKLLQHIGAHGNFRFLFTYEYQRLLKWNDPLDPNAAWTPVPSGNNSASQAFDIPFENFVAGSTTYKGVAVACFVKLQHFVRFATVLNDWQDVMCRMLDPINPEKSEAVAVQWNDLARYVVEKPPTGNPKDAVCLRVAPTKRKRDDVLVPRYYVQINAALDRIQKEALDENWTPFPFGPVLPEPIQGTTLTLTNGENWSIQFCGPTRELYNELKRFTTVARYETATTDEYSPYGPHNESNDLEQTVAGADIANRASIITLFRSPLNRYGAGIGQSQFSMLYTGDAYDRSCDIQNTVAAFLGAQRELLSVDVLKVRPASSRINQLRSRQ